MINVAASKNYATALFESALKADLLDVVTADLNHLYLCLKEDSSIFFQLSSPSIGSNLRLLTTEKAFKGNVNSLTLNFLKIVAHNNRFTLLSETIDIFSELVKAHRKITDAFIVSASEFETEEKDLLKVRLEKKFKKTFNLNFAVNPMLLGGFTIHIGSEFIDNSISGAVREMRLQFKKGN
jgi:F-type H+-transporting ATPase subunit delta